ncbi:S8 family serine peptidase [Sphingobium scionense]
MPASTLSLLTTARDVGQRPLDSFWATSAATAQAARLAAQIAADHPDYWPETIRALMVHSARWTPLMTDAITACAAKRDKADCLRRYGYGLPDLARARASAIDDLALVAQREIQPFRKESSGIRFNEAHVYPLPWPRQILEDLDNLRVRLKVTLSYFIEPNPSFATAIDPARYQSFGLRFDLKRSRETTANFLRRNNAEGREENDPHRSARIMMVGCSASAPSLPDRCTSIFGKAPSNWPPETCSISTRSPAGGGSEPASSASTTERATPSSSVLRRRRRKSISTLRSKRPFRR